MLEMLKVSFSGDGMKFAPVIICQRAPLNESPKDVPCE